MNNELLIPGVPELSDAWIARRTQHLIDEVTTPITRRRRRFVLSGVSGTAVAGIAVLVGLFGPWASPAFAGWSAQPTTPSAGELGAAEATCSSLATNLASLSGGSTTDVLAPVSLSDVRGPYALIVYGTTNPALCVSGNQLTSLQANGDAISIAATISVGHQSGSSTALTNRSSSNAIPSPDGAVANLSYSAKMGGQSFSVAEGSVGSEVSGATFVLSDGSSVVASLANGLIAAWWPGQATVSSIQVTTNSGVN